MTVAELIEELRKMPPDAIVKTDAGEGAWATADEVVDCGSDYEGPRVSIGPRKDSPPTRSHSADCERIRRENFTAVCYCGEGSV